MKTKICSKCKQEKPATKEYFCAASNKKDGLRSSCKECDKKYQSEYYQKNRNKLINASREHYRNNREQCLEKCKQYRASHIKEKKARDHQYYQENKEKIIAYQLEYYRQNKEKCKAWRDKYRKNNPEERRLTCNRRRARKRELSSTLTTEQWEEIKAFFNNRCAYCGEEKPLQQEHFVPLSKGGEYTHNNIIPACMSCNYSKGTKSFFEWYPQYSKYNKEREKTILNFLGYCGNCQQLSLMQ